MKVLLRSDKIKKLYKPRKYSMAKLAKIYDVTSATIYCMLAGKTYQEIK